jgi:hypothetical protein
MLSLTSPRHTSTLPTLAVRRALRTADVDVAIVREPDDWSRRKKRPFRRLSRRAPPFFRVPRG